MIVIFSNSPLEFPLKFTRFKISALNQKAVDKAPASVLQEFLEQHLYIALARSWGEEMLYLKDDEPDDAPAPVTDGTLHFVPFYCPQNALKSPSKPLENRVFYGCFFRGQNGGYHLYVQKGI